MTLSFPGQLRRGKSRNVTAEVSRVGRGVHSRLGVLPGVQVRISE